MLPEIGAALVNAGGSLVSGLANLFTGQSQSKSLMRYQAKLQQEAIDRQNFYNSPSEQMKRLSSAGLNPNLVYGSGVDGNQSSAASPSMSNVRGTFDNPLQDATQAYFTAQQMRLNEIKTRNEAFESRERQLKLRAETLGQMLDNKFLDGTLATRIQHASQKLANDVARAGLIEQQSNNLRVQANVLVEQADYIAERTGLTHQQAVTETIKQKALQVGMRLSEAQIRQAGEYVEFLRAGTSLRRQAHDIQDTQYQAAKIFKEWKAKHPTATLTFEMVKEILGLAGQAASIVVP